MFALLTVALLAQPSQVAVLVSRRTATPPVRASAVAGEVARALRQAGVKVAVEAEKADARLRALGVGESAACEAKPACLARTARLLGVAAVVGVDVGSVKDDLAVSLQGLDTEEKSLAEHSFLTSASELKRGFSSELAGFAETLRASLPAVDSVSPSTVLAPAAADTPLTSAQPAQQQHPSPSTDAPRIEPAGMPAIEPLPPPPPLVIPSPRGTEAPIALYATGGGAVTAAVAAVAFALLGMREAGKLAPLEENRSPVRRSEAEQLAASANRYYSLAGLSLGTAAALGGATVYLFPRDQER